MATQREQAIRERAYGIWEQEGRPDGKDLDHWLAAEAEMTSAFRGDDKGRVSKPMADDEGQLPASSASPENPPPPPSPPWWEALTAKATLVLALGTVALAIVTLVALLVTHADTRVLIKQTRIASNQQHADTLTALGKTDTTIAAMKTQAHIMRGQLDEIQAEHRPWVSVDPKIDSPLQFYDLSARMTFAFTLKNWGLQPAADIFVIPELYITDALSPNAEQTELDRICPPAEPAAGFGFYMFPQEERTQRRNLVISRKEWNDRLSHLPRAMSTSTIVNPIMVYLLGCAYYRFTSKPGPHRSFFLDRLLLKNSPKITKEGSVVITVNSPSMLGAGSVIPSDGLSLEPSIFNGRTGD